LYVDIMFVIWTILDHTQAKQIIT